jgi:hypothetical protein
LWKHHIISTDEDPGLRIESFAVINLRGVSTNKTIICFIAMQTYKELSIIYIKGGQLFYKNIYTHYYVRFKQQQKPLLSEKKLDTKHLGYFF